MSEKEALVVFTPSGKRGHFPHGTPVLQAARKLGVDIDSICGGNGLCGRCQVNVGEGEFAKHGIASSWDHLSEKGFVENRYQEKRNMKADRRLSCQAIVEGDVVIDVPADSQVHKQVVRKSATVRDIAIDPAIRLYYLTVREPDMHDPSGDLERVYEALEQQWEVTGLSTDLHVIQVLQTTLRKGKWSVTVAVHNDERVIAVWPGLRERIFGVAVDLGSTTIAAHVCDLMSGEVMVSTGLMNPQIRFGEDLMSRVSYVMMNPGGDKEMTEAVREGLNNLMVEATKEMDMTPHDIIAATYVGNPVMHHLLLGIDPTELGGAPFALSTDNAQDLTPRDLDLNLHPGARIFVLPCIAGHVGADTAGVALSEAPYNEDEITLIVDVGTNAEMLLGNKDRILAASSPTGPAFEGAQISGGQRAAPGAIERVRIDPETLEPKFRVIGSELWSNEEGFEESIKNTGVMGICGSGIIEVLAEMYLAGIILLDGTIDGNLATKSSRIESDDRTFSYLLHDGEPRICITQNDVRAIQLAKAALYAGARLLMDKLGIDHVGKVKLAGAFGSHIDTKYAMILGMIPDCELEKVTSAGNAAGTGARIALLNKASRQEIKDVVRKIEKIETAVEPRFQEHFINAMAIPHKTDPYPKLSTQVKMPARVMPEKSSDEGEDSGRRRRRRRG